MAVDLVTRAERPQGTLSARSVASSRDKLQAVLT